MAFCTKCGTELAKDSNFCSKCGTKINMQAETGKKCPGCGSPITPLSIICEYCGTQVGEETSSMAKMFCEKLEEIEKSRKDEHNSMWSALSAQPNSTDMKKLTLIKNFPIPNSITDIYEFMIIALSNIDVNLSKNSIFNNSCSRAGISSANIGHVISNAWVTKMEQLYKKAKISFYGHPVFREIEQLYFDKMKELKRKINK